MINLQSVDRFGSSGCNATIRVLEKAQQISKAHVNRRYFADFVHDMRTNETNAKNTRHQTTFGAFSAKFSQPLHCFPNPALAPFSNFVPTWLLLAFIFFRF